MPPVGRGRRDSPPPPARKSSARARGRAARVGGAPQRGPALADPTVDRGVSRAREDRDLHVAVAQAEQVERFALARLERSEQLDALAVLEALQGALFGAAPVRVRRLARLIVGAGAVAQVA